VFDCRGSLRMPQSNMRIPNVDAIDCVAWRWVLVQFQHMKNRSGAAAYTILRGRG
jgi:hypothetical protein